MNGNIVGLPAAQAEQPADPVASQHVEYLGNILGILAECQVGVDERPLPEDIDPHQPVKGLVPERVLDPVTLGPVPGE